MPVEPWTRSTFTNKSTSPGAPFLTASFLNDFQDSVGAAETLLNAVEITANDAEALVTDVEVSVADHLADTVDAHDASAISYLGSTNLIATQVEAALDELDAEKASLVSLNDHLADTVDAHDASAISYAGSPNLVSTDVEAALDEVSDDLLSLSRSEVALSAGSTLAAAALNKQHILSGASHTTVLPTAVGNTSKVIAFRATGSNVYTLDGAGSETIGGLLVLPLTNGDYVLLQSDGANWIISIGDSLLKLARAEVSITGATTLTPGAFGKNHVCSGTSYNLTLPPPAGNIGVIGIRVLPSMTGVTLLPNSGEAIDGVAASRFLWPGASVIYKTDGTNWYEVAGKPMNRARGSFSAYLGSSQTVTALTITLVQMATELWDVNGWYNNATYRFTPQMPGYYLLTWLLQATAGVSGDFVQSFLYKNGSVEKNGTRLYSMQANALIRALGSCIVQANGTTDYFEVRGSTSVTSFGSGAEASFFQGVYLGAL